MLLTIMIGLSMCIVVGLISSAIYLLGTSASDNPRVFVIGTIVVCIVLAMFYAVGLVGERWLL